MKLLLLLCTKGRVCHAIFNCAKGEISHVWGRQPGAHLTRSRKCCSSLNKEFYGDKNLHMQSTNFRIFPKLYRSSKDTVEFRGWKCSQPFYVFDIHNRVLEWVNDRADPVRECRRGTNMVCARWKTEGNSVAFQPYLVKREMICQHLAALCTCCSGGGGVRDPSLILLVNKWLEHVTNSTSNPKLYTWITLPRLFFYQKCTYNFNEDGFLERKSFSFPIDPSLLRHI